jgi:hypothetical protein
MGAADDDNRGGGDAPTKAPGPLKAVVLGNFPLLAAIGGLIGLATFVGALPLYATWVQPFLTFLLLAAATLLWLELLAQWPAELRIDRGPPPPGTPWRLVGFAYVLQLTMVGFIGGFLWRFPRLLIPLLAAGIAIGVWQFFLPRRLKAWRAMPLTLAILALLGAIIVLSLVHPTYGSIFANPDANGL